MQNNVSIDHIAHSLADQHASIYYIDAEKCSYVEFSSSKTYKYLGIPSKGDDFFAESQENIGRVIHADDVSALRSVLDRDYLVSQLNDHGTASITYRLILGGEPTYVNLSATWSEDRRHIVAVISDVDKLVRLEELRQADLETASIHTSLIHKLASEHLALYFVDVESDDYVDFSAAAVYSDKDAAPRGHDFFGMLRNLAYDTIIVDDSELLERALDKRWLLSQLKDGVKLTRMYRIAAESGFSYAQITAQLTDDRQRLIVYIDDVDDQVRKQEEDRKVIERSRIYGHIAQSLASRYATIYFIDVYTKHYMEFAATDTYRELEAPTEGDDFFADSRENVVRVIHPDDKDIVLDIMDRDIMTDAINENGSLSVTYRLLMGGKPVYTNLNATWADDHRHLIVGVADVDAEMQQRLAQKEVDERNKIYGYIAQSLANQYATIYYVDVYTEDYIEFSSTSLYKGLEVPPAGNNFFWESRENAKRVIHPEDYEMVATLFDRDTLTEEINRHGAVSITYRLLIDGRPTYTSLRAVWADDRRHIIIGVSDVDAIMQKELAQKKAEEQSVTYANIAQSLANRYDSIYYVDIATNAYTEYSSNDEYKGLNIEKEGDDFFADSAKNIRKLVFREDLDFALNAVKKEGLLEALEDQDSFSITYRLMYGSTPTFINLRAILAEDKRHLIIGISNVDEEMRREREREHKLRAAHERATRDGLTGVRNKNAYSELEEEVKQRIGDGEQTPFAIVACDVNGLKGINDNQGHAAGDAYIKDASKLICETYTHSPVYRIGGDEFVVMLLNQDYLNRNELLQAIRDEVRANQATGGVVIATGMSVYKEGIDMRLVDVFNRADDLMYENKKALKAAPQE